MTWDELLDLVIEERGACVLMKYRLCLGSQDPPGLWTVSAQHVPTDRDELRALLERRGFVPELIKDRNDVVYQGPFADWP